MAYFPWKIPAGCYYQAVVNIFIMQRFREGGGGKGCLAVRGKVKSLRVAKKGGNKLFKLV